MLINEGTAIYTNRILLVPYCRRHVTTYHDWMEDPDLQIATASEPLSVEEEYVMQQSWRSDADKLTFILCIPPPNGAKLTNHVAEIASMVGDVNMFVSVQEEENGNLSLVGELELMIAIKEFQRKGYGRSALLTFLYYVLQHEKEIVKQYPGGALLDPSVNGFGYFAVKIKEDNGRSISLFEGIGFEKTLSTPSFFGEFELRHYGLNAQRLRSMLSQHGVQDYQEFEYDDETSEDT